MKNAVIYSIGLFMVAFDTTFIFIDGGFMVGSLALAMAFMCFALGGHYANRVR